jgi:hypothetical protein
VKASFALTYAPAASLTDTANLSLLMGGSIRPFARTA